MLTIGDSMAGKQRNTVNGIFRKYSTRPHPPLNKCVLSVVF